MTTVAKPDFLESALLLPVCANSHAPASALEGPMSAPAMRAPPPGLEGLEANPGHGSPLKAPAPETGTGVADPFSSPEPRSSPRQAPEASAEVTVVEGEGRWVGPCVPERPVMEILFRCIEAGRRYYGVRLNGQEIFVGTHVECDRFLKIHNEKVSLEQAEARRTPRGRPAQLHIYRTVRA